MKKQVLAIALASIVVAGSAQTAENPIAARKAMMQNVVAATKMGGAMLKGSMDYNAATAQLILRVMNTASLGAAEHFPEGSETGGETTASPKIWQDMAGFTMAMAKFQTDTAAGIVKKPEDMASFDKAAFGAAFAKVTANCKSCHESYRVKKN